MEAPRHPFQPSEDPNKKPFHLEFGVRESNEGTEEQPILYYERNGFIFKAQLDLLQNTVIVTLDTKREQSLDRDWQNLLLDVETLAQEELQRQREKYSDYFA